MAKLSLGKGLNALLKENKMNNEQIVNININNIVPNPYQPRKNYNKEKLDELILSIKENGVLQPIVVRKNNLGKYEIIFGERRFRSVKAIGLKEIPAIVRKYNDLKAIELALIENIQRDDLNAIEEAEAYEKLILEFKLTHESIAKVIGKTRSSVTNTLRLLKLSNEIKKEIILGNISVGHAKVLLSISNKEDQLKIAQMIIKNNISVRATEREVLKLKTKKDKKIKLSSNYLKKENDLRNIFKVKVKIVEKNSKGKIEIPFKNKEEFNKIVKKLS